jgi:NAD(P)H-hydrate repair Nnr-like enzyme with NAD(P)H-hydrate dehydratase domain
LGTLWHGRAAEVLARQHGQESVYVTDILDYLSFAIRNDF